MARTVDERTLALQAPSTRQIMVTHIEPKDDLFAERRRATFDVEALSWVLSGGKEKLEKRAKVLEALKRYSWAEKSRRHFLTREEEYTGALQASFGIWRLMRDEGLSMDDALIMRALVDFPGGLELHIGMFIPSLRSQATPEQQAKWLPLSLNLTIIGTYAQTELGHGTFVRGLETTATYDKQTQEFVIHSPTLTSTKWWPGGMGKTATHAVVMARLFTDGKDYGPHGFVVQLRSLETHLPLPGIKVGDIGPKFGYGGVDNGYMAFDHVRIPLDHMLMRYAKVTPQGRYVPPPASNSKASYATMVYVRADIVLNAGHALARAATIATRYAAVRRQTAPAPGHLETQVLDYQNTSATLLPLIASAYALHFMGTTMMGMYKKFEKDRDRGDFSSLPELHALSSGLKALCTWITADGIEHARRTCGGHGYSKLSGLPTLFASYVQNVTWEGDNNVLCLQTARYLIKLVVAIQAGNRSGARGSAQYLSGLDTELAARCSLQDVSEWNSAEIQGSALRHVASRLAVEAVKTLTAATSATAGANGGPAPRGGLAFEGPAWNNSTLAMIRLSQAHCMVVLHQNLLDSIASERDAGRLDAPAVAVLTQLASLLAIHHINANLGDYMEDGYLSGAQAAALKDCYRLLLLEVRPNAVGLVDAFAIEDYQLHSALGRQDGDVYRALLDMAQASPLNATEEGPAWQTILKPMMTPMPKL